MSILPRAVDQRTAPAKLPSIMVNLESAKDVKDIERLLKSGVWEMPDGLEAALPHALSQVVFLQNGDKQFIYSTRARTTAARILVQMMGQNVSRNPAPQEVNLNVTPQLNEALDLLKTLPREELEKLAAAHDVLTGMTKPTS